MNDKKTIVITGGTGFIGRYMHAHFSHRNWELRNLGRSQMPPFQWALGEEPDPDAFAHADVLLHCAYDLSLTAWGEIEEKNIQGTERLFATAAEAGVDKFIYISSIAAFEDCQSDYGRAKLACERLIRDRDGVNIRPGMVYGEESEGVYAAMEAWVKSLPVTPILVPSPDLYMCHIQDLCTLLEEVIEQTPWHGATISAGFPAPMSFKQVVQILQRRHGKSKPLLPVPWRLPWLACKTLELVGLRPPFRSDGLIGLMKGDPSPDFATLKSCKTKFREFTEV